MIIDALSTLKSSKAPSVDVQAPTPLPRHLAKYCYTQIRMLTPEGPFAPQNGPGLDDQP